ncbi:MAG: hypothetical protein RMM29_03210 [Planctomycetota bacterium]|nr:hypothetical protein [Planctomycetota bacterium]MDW8372641.1 hypothetical protein [Planctomycetota bacterium]
MLLRRCSLCLLLCLIGASAGEAPPELVEREHDQVLLLDGRTLEGRVLERLPDGSLQFQLRDNNRTIRIGAGMYVELRPRQSAEEAVREVGNAALAARDRRRLLAALRWGQERSSAAAAVLALASAWLTRFPADREVLAIAVALWRKQGNWAAIERQARAALATDPQALEAETWLSEAFEGQKRIEEMEQHARSWLQRQPSALRANLIVARAHERAGHPAMAAELYRKAWGVHRDVDSGLALVRVSYELGRHGEVRALADAVAEQHPTLRDELSVYVAAAAVVLGDLALARELLAAPAPATPRHSATALVHAYARAALAYREGRREEAAAAWRAIDHPAAAFAARIASRQPYPEPQTLPYPWREQAQRLNAALALAAGRSEEAQALLGPLAGQQDAEALRLLRLLRAYLDPSMMQVQALADDVQALRCLAHALACRDDPHTEEVLKRLDQRDPYVLCYRAYLAARRGDAQRARLLLVGAGGLPAELAAYRERLMSFLSAPRDLEIAPPFSPGLVGTDWLLEFANSGIAVQTEDGRLTLRGVMRAEGEPLLRLASPVPLSRLRWAALRFAHRQLGSVALGLEISDGDQQGIAVLADSEGRLRWRALRGGRWQPWTPLSATLSERSELVLDLTTNIIHAGASDGELAPLLPRGAPWRGEGRIALIATSAAGVHWNCTVESLRWRLAAR